MHLCWVITYQAHQTSGASMPCLQHGKRYTHSWHDHHWLLLSTWPGGTHIEIWQQFLQVDKFSVLQGQQTCTNRVFQVAAHSRLFNPYLWYSKEWFKRYVHWPQSFYLCNTLPHPSNSTLGGSPQPTQGKLHQPLCSYYHTASNSYCYLASQDIMQVLWASVQHLLYFCVNPASVECHSLHTSSAMALFSCRVDALLIKLVGHWHSDAMLHYLHVQSCPIMSGLSKLMLAGGNSQLLPETTTMPLPNPSL